MSTTSGAVRPGSSFSTCSKFRTPAYYSATII